MSRTFTLEEQRTAITKFLTRDREQFAIKEAVLKTFDRQG